MSVSDVRRPSQGARRLGGRERGVVMYVAIVVLIVMTLAGLALLRQMGSGSAIAGNVAFKQGATSGADWGVEMAHVWLTGQTNTTSLENNQTNLSGLYFAASFTLAGASIGEDPTSSSTWAKYWADAPVNTDAGTNDRVQFVIHRLCRTTGAVTAGNVCVASNGVSPGRGDDNQKDLPPDPQPYYRVTTRVAGARNTVSYTQVILGSP